MKINILSTLLSLSLVFSAGTVLAVNRADDMPKRPAGKNTVTTPQTTRLNTQSKNRFTEARLKACQTRETSINERQNRLTLLVTNMENNFDSIAQRVKDYYTSTVVPSGKEVPTYVDLVENINTRRAMVRTSLDTAQSDVASFACDSDDPKGDLNRYRQNMQVVIQELKQYRTSVKDLIVAVRSITGTTESSRPTE